MLTNVVYDIQPENRKTTLWGGVVFSAIRITTYQVMLGNILSSLLKISTLNSN